MISKPLPNNFDTRTRKFFAWWPTKIRIDKHWHTVWLETVEAEEEYWCGIWSHVSGKICS